MENRLWCIYLLGAAGQVSLDRKVCQDEPLMKLMSPCLVVCLLMSAALVVAAAGPELTRSQAIATARSILKKNTGACRINKIKSISAARSGGGWRVTARLVMSASGKPLNETAVWVVSEKNGPVPSNQLTAEITHGCP